MDLRCPARTINEDVSVDHSEIHGTLSRELLIHFLGTFVERWRRGDR